MKYEAEVVTIDFGFVYEAEVKGHFGFAPRSEVFKPDFAHAYTIKGMYPGLAVKGDDSGS